MKSQFFILTILFFFIILNILPSLTFSNTYSLNYQNLNLKDKNILIIEKLVEKKSINLLLNIYEPEMIKTQICIFYNKKFILNKINEKTNDYIDEYTKNHFENQRNIFCNNDEFIKKDNSEIYINKNLSKEKDIILYSLFYDFSKTNFIPVHEKYFYMIKDLFDDTLLNFFSSNTENKYENINLCNIQTTEVKQNIFKFYKKCDNDKYYVEIFIEFEKNVSQNKIKELENKINNYHGEIIYLLNYL